MSKFETRAGFCAVQVFKAWKRVDTLIRAIPHLKTKEPKRVGGAGIEYRYMTSQEKCKPKYFDAAGDRIWDKSPALRHGVCRHYPYRHELSHPAGQQTTDRPQLV
jgi:hypothetical protein